MEKVIRNTMELLKLIAAERGMKKKLQSALADLFNSDELILRIVVYAIVEAEKTQHEQEQPLPQEKYVKPRIL